MKITESTEDLYYRRLALVTATEPGRRAVCKKAQYLLAFEAKKRLLRDRLDLDFIKYEKREKMLAERPTRSPYHWEHCQEKVN